MKPAPGTMLPPLNETNFSEQYKHFMGHHFVVNPLGGSFDMDGKRALPV